MHPGEEDAQDLAERGAITASGHPELWAALARGGRHFDRGEYWLAHEAWEFGWHAYRGPDRDYLKGLIQVAAVQYHLARGRPSAALAILGRRVFEHLARGSARWPVPPSPVIAELKQQHRALIRGEAVPGWTLALHPDGGDHGDGR